MSIYRILLRDHCNCSSMLAALIVFLFFNGTSFAQSFVNPSFEADAWGPCTSNCSPAFEICANGWASSPNNPPSGYALQIHIPSPNNCGEGPTPCGNQFVVLDSSTANPGEAWIEQTISGFQVGVPLKLEFAISSEFTFASQIAVTLTNATPSGPTVFAAPVRTSQLWDTWAPQTLVFTPTATTVTFRFTHVTTAPGGSGVGLDCINLTSTTCPGCPAVSTWGLSVLAFLFLGGVALKFGRRRLETRN